MALCVKPAQTNFLHNAFFFARRTRLCDPLQARVPRGPSSNSAGMNIQYLLGVWDRFQDTQAPLDPKFETGQLAALNHRGTSSDEHLIVLGDTGDHARCLQPFLRRWCFR